MALPSREWGAKGSTPVRTANEVAPGRRTGSGPRVRQREAKQADRQRDSTMDQPPPQEATRSLQPPRYRAGWPAELLSGSSCVCPSRQQRTTGSSILFGQLPQFVVQHPVQISSFDLDGRVGPAMILIRKAGNAAHGKSPDLLARQGW